MYLTLIQKMKKKLSWLKLYIFLFGYLPLYNKVNTTGAIVVTTGVNTTGAIVVTKGANTTGAIVVTTGANTTGAIMAASILYKVIFTNDT